MKNFADRTAFITGAGSGIGQALAVALAGRGCHLALADRDGDGLQATRGLAERHAIRCSTHLLDVTDRSAVEAAAAAVLDRHGAVHLLFNNAGVTLVDRIESQSLDDFEWVMNVNFWGVVLCTRAFLPALQEADEAHIVNISSLFGLMSVPWQGAYNASKFAVRGFTESLKMELAGSRVAVSCVHPGGIKTAIVRNARFGRTDLTLPRDGLITRFDRAARTTPEQAAAAIIRGIRKGRRRILVGGDARLADWIVRLFPGSYEKILRLEKLADRLAVENSPETAVEKRNS